MKTRMADTSLSAYENNLAKLDGHKQEIYDCIVSRPNISALGISRITGLKINVVTGRINDLVHLQLIKVTGKQQPRNVNTYSVRKPSDPLNTFPVSWEEKYHLLKEKYETVVFNARKLGIDIEQTVMF